MNALLKVCYATPSDMLAAISRWLYGRCDGLDPNVAEKQSKMAFQGQGF